jgi:hypothetical protein
VLGRTICAEAVSTQNGPACRRLEWHSVSLTALVARDFKSLSLSSWSSSASKVRATRITAGLAAFGMSKVPFSVVFLFALGKWERCSTFRTSDFKVWHGAFSP